jgi:hypothetical protein
MGCHRVKNPAIRLFLRSVLPIVMSGLLLVLSPGALGQHFAQGHSAGFSGGYARGFSGGGFHGGFSAPRSFGGFTAPAPRGFSAAPRMNWTAPRYNFNPPRNPNVVYRPSYGGGNHRGGDHRERYRRRYSVYGFGGYPYQYPNSWEPLPWDLGYPEFTGYGDDNGAAEPNSAQVQPSDEEQQQRPQEDEGFRPDNERVPYQSPVRQTAASTPPREEPEMTLIFLDGHTQVIRNFVLTPRDVIVMDDAASGRVPRISLSELNLPATEQAARQNGLDFSPPSR